MRFVLDQSISPNTITCLPEFTPEETGTNDLGRPIILSTHTLTFNVQPRQLPTPDHLALICFVVWYPYLAKSTRIIFPQPVSPIWTQILTLHHLTTNINLRSSDLASGDGASQKSEKHRIALAWGGGLDTWAAYKLQPDIYTILVHEREPNDPPIFGPNSSGGEAAKFICITSNQKSISLKSLSRTGTSAGWATWIGVAVTSIWLSADHQINMIATGGNLGSVFLNNGSKYHPTHIKPSSWYRTFELVGLPIYLPLAGLTDLAVIKILGPDLNNIRYCWFPTKTGDNCHKCPKCIRKETLLGRGGDISKVNNFIGPSYDYIRNGGSGDLAKWVYHYYGPALKLIPYEDSLLEQNLLDSLKKHSINILPKSYEYLVEHYGMG